LVILNTNRARNLDSIPGVTRVEVSTENAAVCAASRVFACPPPLLLPAVPRNQTEPLELKHSRALLRILLREWRQVRSH